MTASVRLYNSLGRSLTDLEPTLTPGEVGIYCCGPTVYNYQHIGNLRTYVFEDVLARMLRQAGYRVRHVMNITDVGHLVSDADQGEDKMLLAARREGKRSEEIAAYYTDIFFQHCEMLNILRPDVVCKATEHIPEMIRLIERLESVGAAYPSGGNVYFDVSKFERYGELAGLDLESLKAGARIEIDDRKRNPLDFALWFTRSKFENQELQWESPWGRGYPGWHIECSAMAMHYLGEEFDIHCGGIDHIPVHHTNEIAQSEGATGKRFARIWMHGAFLTQGKDKMSKSAGEFLKLDLLTERGFSPASFRLLCLGAHYRSELSWSWKALEGAENTLRRLKNAVLDWGEAGDKAAEIASANSIDYLNLFANEVRSDLHTPGALSILHKAASDDAISPGEKLALLSRFDEVLGLGIDKWLTDKTVVPQAVSALVQKREEARAARNWAGADELRAEIRALGFNVEDTPAGPKVRTKT